MADFEQAAASAVDDGQFDAGFKGENVPVKTAKPAPAETPRAEEKSDEPEYVQISAKDWAEVRAAAAKTASYDQQLSRAFGTLGNLQKLVNNFQAQTPTGRKVEIPKDAFAAMERDFPELAQQTRSALEAALSGISGTGASDVDPARLETMLATYTAKREIEALEDRYPTWREIVGAVGGGEQPDPNNAFRKWLATKDTIYQHRVNNSESASVIGRAINLFQKETVAPPAKANGTPRDTARAERIKAAVQPKGDGAAAPASRSEDDDFLAGFNSR